MFNNKNNRKKEKNMQAIAEILFDVVYLVSVVTIGILMIKKCRGNMQYKLFGIMAVTL